MVSMCVVAETLYICTFRTIVGTDLNFWILQKNNWIIHVDVDPSFIVGLSCLMLKYNDDRLSPGRNKNITCLNYVESNTYNL